MEAQAPPDKVIKVETALLPQVNQEEAAAEQVRLAPIIQVQPDIGQAVTAEPVWHIQ
jgi:hypothetical protein